ncbi:toprim domain-containing protein [Kribbella sp. NPDC051587]|uniref:toprim domain-containing protein n=1 Tax=Kribbella sp. NPDC051587 TaxID=3364119 RepID=UPI00378CE3C6
MAPIELEMHQRATEFYVRQLRQRPAGWAAAHLHDRGLDSALEDPAWRIGYAPDGWTALTDHLRKSGFNDKSLVAAGLATPTINGYLVDRFRDRIMFPVENADLEVVAFSGRSRGGRARYLNSPTTKIYRKSETTVGLVAQCGKLLRGATPVLVEGVMDALAVDQLGARWAGISTCGTAVSPQQAAMIRQLSPCNRIVVAFDPDLGGRLGAVRSLGALSGAFGAVQAAVLPDGYDVADLFKVSPARLAECLSAADALAGFAIEVELAKWERVLDHLSGRVNALRAVVPFVRQLPSGRVAGEIARLSERLDLEVAVVTREVLTPATRRRPGRSAAGWNGESLNWDAADSRTP